MQRKIILIPKLDIKNRRRPGIIGACVLVMIAAIGLWIAAIASGLLPEAMSPDRQTLCVNLIYYIPFLGIPAAILLTRSGDVTDALRLDAVPVLPAITISILAMLSTYFASLLAAVWGIGLEALGLHSLEVADAIDTKQALLTAVITEAAIPAVFEEFLYRGIVFSAWEKRGTVKAIVVSSLLFAFSHGNLFGLPAYLFVGAMSAYLVFAMDSVYAGIIYHTVYNTTCLVVTYLTRTVTAETAEAGMDLLSLAGDTLMMALMAFASLMTVRVFRKVRGIHAIPKEKAPLSRSEMLALILTFLVMLPMLALVLYEGGSV